jgi:hypothetical protein
MEKIQLIVLGLSASPASNNAYALILKEVGGDRRLPIMIGAFEAQAIALELEGVIPPRPMTHDLIKNIIDSFNSSLSEVYINDLADGTFFAKLVFDGLGIEVDCRPSDAIAIAVRCNCPIYITSDIMEETSLMSQGDEMGRQEEYDDDMQYLKKESQKQQKSNQPRTRIEQLQVELDKAIKDENYERASVLRDEIKRFLESS